MNELKDNEGEDEVLTEMESKLDQNPEDIQLIYDIAQHLFSNEKYEEAIDYCIDIIAIGKSNMYI